MLRFLYNSSCVERREGICVTVAHRTLTPFAGVRIPHPLPKETLRTCTGSEGFHFTNICVKFDASLIAAVLTLWYSEGRFREEGVKWISMIWSLRRTRVKRSASGKNLRLSGQGARFFFYPFALLRFSRNFLNFYRTPLFLMSVSW